MPKPIFLISHAKKNYYLLIIESGLLNDDGISK